jgi:Zn-dependent M28 family amino/carboxypeptidase
MRNDNSKTFTFVIMKILKVLAALAIGFISSCQYFEKSSEPNVSSSPSTVDINTIQFDENLAYQYIEKQVSFGPRVPSTSQHKACADWILSVLETYTDTSYFQEFTTVTYDGKKHQGKNIIAKLNPSNPNRILLCAHWDTRPIADKDTKNQNKPILGANDAGSGVGVTLAILDAVKKSKTKLGIDIVFFDIEDYGQPTNSQLPPMENSWCLGSQYWGKNYQETNRPRWGILLDMVGGKDATFYREEISMLYASNLVGRVWENADKLGHNAHFLTENIGTIQDDHLYVNTMANIPTIDIIDYKLKENDFAAYHHTHGDNMNSVDKNTLKAVGRVLLYTIYQEEQIGL